MTVRTDQVALGDLSITTLAGHAARLRADVEELLATNVIEVHDVRRVLHPAVGTRPRLQRSELFHSTSVIGVLVRGRHTSISTTRTK